MESNVVIKASVPLSTKSLLSLVKFAFSCKSTEAITLHEFTAVKTIQKILDLDKSKERAETTAYFFRVFLSKIFGLESGFPAHKLVLTRNWRGLYWCNMDLVFNQSEDFILVTDLGPELWTLKNFECWCQYNM